MNCRMYGLRVGEAWEEAEGEEETLQALTLVWKSLYVQRTRQGDETMPDSEKGFPLGTARNYTVSSLHCQQLINTFRTEFPHQTPQT